MEKENISAFRLIGIRHEGKTTNEGGQSNIDCGNLWQRFEKEKIGEQIMGKIGHAVYAVYFEYEGDHLQPFSYFIGCKAEEDAPVPEGLSSIHIPAGTYAKVVAKGQMPDCIGKAWKEIWDMDIDRAYRFDFELYDERCADWNNAELDIFLSIN